MSTSETQLNKVSPELEKLFKVFDTDRIISPEEIEQVLGGIINIIQGFQQKNELINQDVKKSLGVVLQQIGEDHNNIMSNAQALADETKAQVEERVNAQIKEANAKVQNLVNEVKSIVPKDGEDADEARVIAEVLSQIKLPEYKEVMLDDGEQLIDKINSVPTGKGSPKIDAKHIKGLPKPQMNNFPGGGPGYTGPKITVSATAPMNPAENDLWVDIS